MTTAHTPPLDRSVPPPMTIAFSGGDVVELLSDQLFADKVRATKGERGRVMYPSSQAAAWVVSFPRLGAKYRVVAEKQLRLISHAKH